MKNYAPNRPKKDWKPDHRKIPNKVKKPSKAPLKPSTVKLRTSSTKLKETSKKSPNIKS